MFSIFTILFKISRSFENKNDRMAKRLFEPGFLFLFSEPAVLLPLKMAATRALYSFARKKGVFGKRRRLNYSIICRYTSIKAQSLVYSEFGDPGKVLK